MAKLNILKLSHLAPVRTHEGGPAKAIAPEQALRRSVLACMLWEDEFYEDGVQIAGRIRELVPKVDAAKVAALAVEAREAMKLRHVPLLLVREMARHASHRSLVAEALARVIQRADELSEFMAIYWADGRAPLSGQVKKGSGSSVHQIRRVCTGQVRPCGCGPSARRTLPLPCQAEGCRPGRLVEAADRRQPVHS